MYILFSILILNMYIIQYILIYVFSYIITTLSSMYISKSPSKPFPLSLDSIIARLPQLLIWHNQQAITVHTNLCLSFYTYYTNCKICARCVAWKLG
jgi:hypothetical protein